MESGSEVESDIKSWLQVVLKKENLKNLSVNVLGNTEKGSGYVGDVVFVDASGTADDGSKKQYGLVLKCSKRSQALREKSVVKEAFLNEIYMYETVFPAMTQFQLNKGVTDYFDSVPKCYGSYIDENMEIIVFDNLTKLQYSLWSKKKPLSRIHINLVVKEYGKLHATSIALQNQHPDAFQKFLEHFECIFAEYAKKDDLKSAFTACIEEVCDVLKDDLEEKALERWQNLKEQINFIFQEMFKKSNVQVIVHGDCWNNNFMFYYDKIDLPKKVAILDWQVSRFSSPIVDLSYFIFACISEDDLEEIENILGNYHESFSQHLIKLGTDPKSTYSFDQLLEDWRTYCKFGVLMTSLIFKICSTEKDEEIDIGEAAEQGVDFGHSFMYEIKNKSILKSRMKPIIQYVVKHDLI